MSIIYGMDVRWITGGPSDPDRGLVSSFAGDAIAGHGSFQKAWWSDQPGTFEVQVEIEHSHRGKGYGSALYREIEDRLVELGASRIQKWICGDPEGGILFARAHGFRETGKVLQNCTLDLSLMPPQFSAGITPDIGIRALSDFEACDDGLLRQLHALSTEGLEAAETSFDAWMAGTICGEGHSFDTTWVAMSGNDVVGMTYLTRLSQADYENDYTVVSRPFRGRRIATALKHHSIAWALNNEVKFLHTSSLVENQSIRSINERLGYVDGAKEYQFEKYLVSVDAA